MFFSAAVQQALAQRLGGLLAVLTITACTPTASGIHPASAKPQWVSSQGVTLTPYTCAQTDTLKGTALLSAQVPLSKGWSHVIKPAKAEDFKGLQQPLAHYSVRDKTFMSDATCNYLPTFNTTLVKKVHSWQNNHGNGLETAIPAVPFKAWESVEIIFRVNRAKSAVPTVAQLQQLFPELPDITKLDSGLANISVLFREGEYEAHYLMALDPNTQFDQWFRLVIPASQFSLSQKINYVHTALNAQQMANRLFATLSLKAETQSRRTARHLNNSVMPKNMAFKEVDLTLYRIALHHL